MRLNQKFSLPPTTITLMAAGCIIASFPFNSIGQQKDDFAVSAQQAGYSVVGRGANDKTWSKVTWETNDLGIAVATTNSTIVEVASGMHYFSGGEYRESRDLIELTEDGRAMAAHGPCKAYFERNLNTAGGAISYLTASNRTFKTQPVALFFYDAGSGQAVRIATVIDCVAELLPPNQIVWRGIFDKVRADLRITYTKMGIESDLILLEKPPFAPEDFNMDPARTRIELWHWW